MGKALNFLLVCEGPTDLVFLKRLARNIGQDLGCDINVTELSPQRDATSGTWPPHGWSEVRRWCQTWKIKSDAEIESVNPIFREMVKRRNWKALVATPNVDGLIVQIDTDIAEEIRDLDVDFVNFDGTRREFCHKAVSCWLDINNDEQCYILLPSYALEAWILATHEPDSECFKDLEDSFNYENISDIETFLLQLGYPRKTVRGAKRFRKNVPKYNDYADLVFENSPSVQMRCKEYKDFSEFLDVSANNKLNN
ncbi:hypothetical protein KW447_12415 [Vibrio fluvialis]|nr:hypothetical protein [Vibrio fluvialis]